jgi:hypothetical protein
MMPTTVDALTTIVHFADKLAHDLPRNLDAATLTYAARELAVALGAPAAARALVSAPPRKHQRRRPGYWAEGKRIQRARKKLERLGRLCAHKPRELAEPWARLSPISVESSARRGHFSTTLMLPWP